MHHSLCSKWIGPALTALFLGSRLCSAVAVAGELTSQQIRVLTGTTIQAMLDIARARRAIHDNDPAAAKKALGDAKTLFSVVRMELPTSNLRNRIAIAEEHLSFDLPLNVLPDLVPIYSELEVYDSVSSKVKARQHLDKARADLQKGDRNGAMAELDAVKNAVRFHEIDVPLSRTDLLVSKAVDLIEEKKMSDANKTLVQAEKGLDSDVVAAISATPSPRRAE